MKKLILGLALMALPCNILSAAVVFVGVEAGITGDGLVDWGDLGPSFTVVPQPFSIGVTGIGGLTMLVGQASSISFERRDEDNGWAGDFAPGEELLWTAGLNGPLILTFSSGVGGVGTQIQRNSYGAYTGTIEAFDSSLVSLGLFGFGGTSGTAGDDSAIFVGVLSDAANIARVVISLDIEDFAVSGPRVQTDGAVVPEPSTVGLILLGVSGLFYYRRRKLA